MPSGSSLPWPAVSPGVSALSSSVRAPRRVLLWSALPSPVALRCSPPASLTSRSYLASPFVWKGFRLLLAPPSSRERGRLGPWSKTSSLYLPLEHLSPIDGLPWRTLGFAHLRVGCAHYLVCPACSLVSSALLLSFSLF